MPNKCCTNLQLVDSETLEPILVGGLPVTKPNLPEDPDFIPCEPDSPDCTPEPTTTTTPPIPIENICYMRNCFPENYNPSFSEMDYMWINCSQYIAGLQPSAPGVTINEWSTVVSHVIPAASLTAMGATMFAPAHFYGAAGVFNSGNCYYEEIWYQNGIEVARTTTANQPAGGIRYTCTHANGRVNFNNGSPVTLDPNQDLTIEFRIYNCGGGFFDCSDPDNLPVSKLVQLRVNLKGFDCPGDPPPPPLVSCCIEGVCQNGLEEEACIDAGGIVISNCTECEPPPPPVINSCCYWTGKDLACIEGDTVSEDGCLQLIFENPEPPMGVSVGWNSGATCSESNCEVKLGYCCANGSCYEGVTYEQCFKNLFGDFWFDASDYPSCEEACGPSSNCAPFKIQASTQVYDWDVLGSNQYCAMDGFAPASPGFIVGFEISVDPASSPFHTSGGGIAITDPDNWIYGRYYGLCEELCDFDISAGFQVSAHEYLYFAQVNVGTGLVGINVVLYVANGCATDYKILSAC